MKITFVSNYINHHQIPLCTRLYEALGSDFQFIQTQEMTQERLKGGWAQDAAMFSYVRFWQKEREALAKLFVESDVVLLGWSKLPAKLIEYRLSSGKITLRVSERIYKEGQWKALSPRGLAAKYKEHIRYRKSPVYLLCAGAYVSSDFAKIHSYPHKMYRWGYFPETRVRKATQWEEPIGRGPVRLCWAGRMIDWKHPEYALQVAKTLRNKGYEFVLQMIGDGPMRKELEAYAEREQLWEKVVFRKTLTPYETRGVMENSHIYLFTSNYLEGWGAVVNEAMNSACAVVASQEAGSVPYLITNGVNGLTYHNGQYDKFEEQVLQLMEVPVLQEQLGKKAFRTITRAWNAEVAADRLLAFSETLLATGRAKPYDDNGPLSIAPVYRAQSFFRTLQERNVQDRE